MLVWKAPVDTVSNGKWKYGGKGINFIFCLGTTYDISSMESIGNYSVVFIDRKSMPPQMFLYLSFLLWALAPLQIPTSVCEGPFYLLYAIFIFYLSLHLLLKHQLRGTMIVLEHWVWLCFMNGSMIDHNGLGITFFSVDILKDMVACWYAWVLKS